MVQRCRERQRKLRAGSEPGVSWNGSVDRNGKARVDLRQAGELCQNLPGAFDLHTANAHLRSTSHADARLVRIDREPEAAEASAETAIHVEEAEVQTSRRPDSYAIDHRSRRGVRGLASQGSLSTLRKNQRLATSEIATPGG